MINILIADDHPIVREGLKQIIAEAPDIVVAAEASNGYELLDKVRNIDFSVVVLDITMPGITGLDVLKQLKSEKPGLPILILSMHSEEQYAVRVLRAGASGYLTKASAPDQLIGAIRKVFRGGKYVSPSVAEKLAYELDSESEKQPHEYLSDREYQVLCLIASGKTVKVVAEELSLSVKTVSTYRSRILDKMRMNSNAEITHYAIKHRLVD
ncbi:MAG: response regulator transcription factor [Deltaproteobacteria bacterium]|nr:MAG: response regulator transcription factor [Deltaproteobacteria bacterium]